MPNQGESSNTITLAVEIRANHRTQASLVIDTSSGNPEIREANTQQLPLDVLGAVPWPHDPPPEKNPRILLVGDSWAEDLWKPPGTFKEALIANGLSPDEVVGECTALGATKAENWQKDAPRHFLGNDYEQLRSYLDKSRRSHRDKAMTDEQLIALKQDAASLWAIKVTLDRYPTIKIVHLSLGGNDLLGEITNDVDAKSWLTIWHSDPNDALRVDYTPESLLANGWRRDEATIDRARAETAMVNFTRKVGTIASRITDRLTAIIGEICKMRPGIRICICGYTQMFLNPAKSISIEDARQRIDKKENNLPYIAGPMGSSYQYFNGTVLATFERVRQEKWPQGGTVVFQPHFFLPRIDLSLDPDSVNKYYGDENLGRNEDFRKLKKWLDDTGFHLKSEGHRELANSCIRRFYKNWLDST